jgi:hypothetical protein
VAAGAAHRGLAFALQKLRWNRISNSTKAGHQTSGTCPSREYPFAIQPHFQKALGPIADSISGRAGKAPAANSSTGVKMSLNICSYYVTNNPVRQMRAIGVVRLLLVLVMSISWFVLANHCVLAVAVARAQVPAHNCCGTDKAGDRAPAKERQQGGGECCKTLDVTLVPAVKNLTGFYCWSVLPAYLIAPVTLADAAQSTQTATELDTGPPCASSFAETVLQRSILVHAPPSLA